MRPSGRAPAQIRPIQFTRHFTKHAEGSVLVSFGDTQVLCTASLIDGVPRFLKGQNKGWVTAEYGMLPRSTHSRIQREASQGKQSGRTQEIQRLIGRALRACVDLEALGDHTISIDCDVLQADGGTRTAAISGACVALVDALAFARQQGLIKTNPLKHLIGAVSVGIYKDQVVADLDYLEDSSAETDMNFVMTEMGTIIEVQGTAEKNPFSHEQMLEMLELAQNSIREICDIQKTALL